MSKFKYGDQVIAMSDSCCPYAGSPYVGSHSCGGLYIGKGSIETVIAMNNNTVYLKGHPGWYDENDFELYSATKHGSLITDLRLQGEHHFEFDTKEDEVAYLTIYKIAK